MKDEVFSLRSLRTSHEHLKWREQISLEESYMLSCNLLRSDRCLCVTDSVNGEAIAVGTYLKGMPFHAFSVHLFDGAGTYSMEYMLAIFREELGEKLPVGSTGVLAVNEDFLDRLMIPNILSHKTMLLMKLTQPERLAPAGISRLLELSEAKMAEEMAEQLGMIAFRAEEVVEMPHLALFSETGEPMAIGGFHMYTEEFVELGNIGTSVHHRKKGLGTQITSDVSRLGLQKSSLVYLVVFADNPAAIHLYEQLGYETVAKFAFVEFSL
ncbi:GCN5 family acetyltransferase [Brevibacillus reuszeri]|uniref:GCN5 family acetyltransferase n=2 Tax=Brevibacillus reuszeri TaxID=54915 RepID=A0A0K9Z159_9BACL|nr:GCN5 family acetyltransferase [Brevibacillus reuszeri]